MLSGFELYPRWVPLIKRTLCKQRDLKSDLNTLRLAV